MPARLDSREREASFSFKVARRFRRVRFPFGNKSELDAEDEEVHAPARQMPDRLDAISRATKFSKDEIRYVYRAFKAECPSGVITEPTFKHIFAKFFPLGDSSQYAHYIFTTLDRSQTGTVTFRDLMAGLSMIMKGTLQERLCWAFSLYDVNRDGFITRQEMLEVISAIYSLLGDKRDRPRKSTLTHVNSIFQKLDLNNDGVITIDEFIDYCSKDENIIASFSVFDDLW
ncbi:Kv channel-interacting protein 4-like [Bacillus rossius redtenbacheri]|uniref:Kv channel-interacting protein 4-like n=1 Tax=Bacillus rossius redtenbacheri TaxID=93214 RepID=UPI002FDE1A93